MRLEGRFCIVGGAGFIGSHFVDRLLSADAIELVRVFDNFSSGREWHLAHHQRDARLEVRRGEVSDAAELTEALEGCDTVIHLASNPDIARAVTDPAIDFHEGTALTHAVLEASRQAGVRTVLYASGSGVYGDLGEMEMHEDHGPMEPISTYGASKLAGEALLCAYSHMFDIRGRAFRFGNVVGPRQTHGVGFDFIRRLLENPDELRILGDGSQSKSYVHVTDIVEAVLTAAAREPLPYRVFNVATTDYPTVLEIAEMAVEVLGRDRATVKFVFTGGDRGWRGDVPVMRLDTQRIRHLGWQNEMSSRDALRASMVSLLEDARAGRFG